MKNFLRAVAPVALAAATLSVVSESAAAVSLAAGASPYSQNFDTLAMSGSTNTTMPLGWEFVESDTNANTTYATGTGSSATGNTYSFGADLSGERALGGLASGSLQTRFGASFTNNTGGTITSLTISFNGEQWRNGDSTTDKLDVAWSTDATSLTTGTWTDLDTLDFTPPCTGSVGATDGNGACRTAKTLTLNGLSIANGTTFWLRWVDDDATGSDDGLAIDDFSLAYVHSAPPGGLANGAACTDGTQCSSTHCVDNVCCNDACTGTCQACSTAAGAATNGTCGPSTGRLKACNDGSACTLDDKCELGACVGASPVDCGTPPSCRTGGTCNPMTGTCTFALAPAGTPCNDGDLCTTGDVCNAAGTCVSGTPTICREAAGECHDLGVCVPATGLCTTPAKPDSTPCGGATSCIVSKVCMSGMCVGGTPTTCPAPDQCHNAGTCNTTTGACDYPAKPNGTPCDDGNKCTASDTCQAGVCTGSSPVTCATPDQCHTAGTCDPVTGTCTNPAKPDGVACSDGLECTSDFCIAGVCESTLVPLGAPCTGGVCNGALCVPATPTDAGPPDTGADAALPDTAAPDTFVPDTAPADTSPAGDTMMAADTTVADTSAGDTDTPDTTVATDSETTDTLIEDTTTVADTGALPDTAVADTGELPADGSGDLEGGCGCSTPGGASNETNWLAAACVAFVVTCSTRRRRRSSAR